MTDWPVHGRISGPIVMIGFGSIGKGALPLIERHFEFDRKRLVVIDPDDVDRELVDVRGYEFIKAGVTKDNYRELLTPLLTRGGGQGFCVNLSVDTSSLAIMELCREIGALYIDTVVEPWAGLLFRQDARPGARSNYALRETVLASAAASRRDDRRFLLRRQSRHGLLVRETGSGQSRRRSRRQGAGAENPRGMGARSATVLASRAFISPSATPSAPRIPSRAASSSTPGRSRVSVGRPAAGRTRLGHA